MLKRYRFGAFRLDLNLRSLSTEDGQSVELTPKAIAVLTYLIENRDRVVSKEELLSGVWPGTSVNDSVVHVNISIIRNALERHGGRNFIKTSSSHGYHFAEPVEEWFLESSAPARTTNRSDEAPTDPGIPRPELLGINESRQHRRLWVTALAVAAILVAAFASIRAYQSWRRYVNSPRYIASKYLSDAVRAHDAGHDQESIELARKAIDVDPSFARAYLLAAWWESLNKVEDRTIQTDAFLDELKSRNTARSQTELQLEEGLRADNRLNVAEAERRFHEATVLSPGDVDAWRFYGYELDNKNLRFDAAVSAFRKCLSIEPKDTDCVVGQLQSQNALNQFDKSIELFNSLPEEMKQTPWVLEEFGYAQMGHGNYTEAMKAFEGENRIGQSADEVSAIDGSIDGRVQSMLLLGKDPIEVASYLEEEIQKYVGMPLQNANWELDAAAIYATSGRESECSKHSSKALAISDDWQKSHKTAVSLIDPSHAIQFLAMCRDIHTASQQADMYGSGDREFAALRLFIEAIGLMASPSSTRGAIEKLEQAYDHDPNPLYDFYRGQALLNIGDPTGARLALQRFLDHRGEFQEGYIGLALLIPHAEKDLAAIQK